MSIIEQIRTFVKDRLEENKRLSKNNYIFAHNQSEDEIFLRYLDTLQEQPACEDLEEAANEFAHHYDNGTCDGIAQDCFIAGAEWQKEQMMKVAKPRPYDWVEDDPKHTMGD